VPRRMSRRSAGNLVVGLPAPPRCLIAESRLRCAACGGPPGGQRGLYDEERRRQAARKTRLKPRRSGLEALGPS